MPFLVLWGLLLPPAAALALLFRKKTEETLALALLGIICGGYLLSLFGLLRTVPFILYAAWGMAAFYLAYILFIKKSHKLRALLTPGLLAAVGLSALAWWLCRGMLYSGWDEFSHWGLAVKNMFYLDGLYTSPLSSAGFKSYPPALALLQYTLLKAGRFGFREDVALFIPKLLAVCLLVWPLSKVEWKRSPAPLLGALFSYFCVAGLYISFLYETSIDSLLGVVLAFLLMLRFMARWEGWFYPALFCMGCFVLALLKGSGFGLAIFALLFAAGETLRHRKAFLQSPHKKTRAAFWLQFLLPAAAVLLAKYSWQLHLHLAGVAERWQAGGISLGAIAQLLGGGAPAYRYEVLHLFWQSIFSVRNYGNVLLFAPALWLAAYLVLALITFALLPKEKRRRWAGWAGALAGCNILYVLSLLATYLFVFHPEEAVLLASFSRYLDTIILTSLLFLLGGLFAAVAESKAGAARRLAGAVLAAAVLLGLFSPVYVADRFVRTATFAAQTHHDRYLSQQSASRILALEEENPRVYFVSQRDNGLALMKLQYEIAPQRLPDHYSSISSLLPDPDLSTAPYTVDEWADILAGGFDYVYLYSIDGYFTAEYAPLFEDPAEMHNDRMFTVVRLAGGGVQLRRLLLPDTPGQQV